MKQTRRRIRWTLLVLLWVWAGCIGLVLDLFWNVEHFDRVRSDAEIYRAARYVAHRMVGEPYQDADGFGRVQSAGPRLLARRTAPAERTPAIDPGRYRVGARPDAATPAGSRFLAGLERVAQTSDDPQRRIAALRSMARMFKADARSALLQARDDADPAVREAVEGFIEETER